MNELNSQQKVVYLSYKIETDISAEIGFSLREYFENQLGYRVDVRNYQPTLRSSLEDQIGAASIIVCIITKSYDNDKLKISELLYINSLNKPIVYIMLDKLPEIEHIGLILVNKKFVKAYKDKQNFKEKRGNVFSEFQNIIEESINKSAQSHSK